APALSHASADASLTLELMTADPAPPARGTNSWNVRLTDGSGAPISGVALEVTPFMPDHGHGTSVVPTVTAGDDGTYAIQGLYLFMPGVWRVTFALDAHANGTDPNVVNFFFCVAG